LCTFSDISERKRTQEKLEGERALLRCLIDSASDLIFIKDRDSVYRACNKASETFIGIPESEPVGKTDDDFFGRAKAEQIRAADRQVLSEGNPLQYEEWVTDRDGRRLLMDTLKTPYYDPNGEPLGLVGIGRDLTERKRQEEERLIHLRFLQNMDRINRTIQANNDLEQMMRDVLGVGLVVLDCDRAFILTHLIANAVKFTRHRGKARIEIGWLPDQDTESVIFVRDNGVGFDMAYADKLFGVFQRLHRSEAFEGTGIGLVTVHRIVARLGGRTWTEGEMEQGATFFFSLPREP
jgi:PAS domain S-box-containing protein